MRATTPLTGTVNSSGDNTLIAAPLAGQRIVVTGFVVQNESSTATTMVLKSGTVAAYRFLGQSQGAFFEKEFAVGSEWRLAAGAALVLNLSGANSCGYSISYFVEGAF